MAQMSIEAMEVFLAEHFPQGKDYGRVESIGHHSAMLRLNPADAHLRPGGTVSGPAMMALADVAMYVALLGEIGPVPLAVTTNLNINFLQRPAPDMDLLAEAKLLKLGKRLAVGEVTIYSEGEEMPVAHVTCTYSIPPGDSRPND
ncbi:PaaI family thioesterase [Motiliproteus sp. MSK22-1]|uniref:PaaI family thioesterase n=1 Tax=Motiliproteus sp. MSK22-1 TaxID=1897630 RepID=UPI00097731AE|nr:PaaI family thioesterase [Motiliproteus sp. MSK22-1]OMH35351.1 phenylacetic acid degradation protein [Motiliproteus sp. MSK22-1]